MKPTDTVFVADASSAHLLHQLAKEYRKEGAPRHLVVHVRSWGPLNTFLKTRPDRMTLLRLLAIELLSHNRLAIVERLKGKINAKDRERLGNVISEIRST